MLPISIFACLLLAEDHASTQQLQEQPDEEGAYGSGFFNQLRAIFGKFRDMDLQRAFREAQPIHCSELVGRKGEWRPVAFFNENRRLGDWCRESLAEVKADLSVYTFQGKCQDDQSRIQVITEFPTAESMKEFSSRQIDLTRVDIMVNDPVEVFLNASTGAYTFELPYLFLTSREGSSGLYSFIAPNRNASYSTEVSSRWECKAISSRDVTYRFLICRTATIPRGNLPRNKKWEPSFGSSAFFILSDGMKTHTSIKVRVDDGTQYEETPKDAAPAPPKRPELKKRAPEK